MSSTRAWLSGQRVRTGCEGGARHPASSIAAPTTNDTNGQRAKIVQRKNSAEARIAHCRGRGRSKFQGMPVRIDGKYKEGVDQWNCPTEIVTVEMSRSSMRDFIYRRTSTESLAADSQGVEVPQFLAIAVSRSAQRSTHHGRAAMWAATQSTRRYRSRASASNVLQAPGMRGAELELRAWTR